MVKKMTKIESGSVDPSGRYKTFDPDILNMAQNLGSTQTIAGQDIERSSQGTRASFDVGDEIKKGDIIHGVTKYIGKSGETPGDLDFTYRKSTRKGKGGNEWTITGHN